MSDAPTPDKTPTLLPPVWWRWLLLGLYAVAQIVYITATPLQPIVLPDNVPPAQAEVPLLVGLGPDEKEHFLYIVSLAEQGSLPAQAPRFRSRPDQYVSYEMQHPPLFYVLAVPFYKLLGGRASSVVWLGLRGLCALLGALAALLAARAAQVAFPNRPLVTWGALPLALFLPTFGHTMGCLSNEPLASLIGAALWLQTVRLLTGNIRLDVRAAAVLGVLLGLGALTRLTTLVWLPGVAAALLLLLRRVSPETNRVAILLAFAVPFLLLWAPWLVYLQSHFGTIAFRSHNRPLLENITLAEYLQNPNARLFPKNVPRGVVMPPSYLLLWGVSTAIVPYWLILFYLPGGPAFGALWQTLLLLIVVAVCLVLFLHSSRSRRGLTPQTDEPGSRAVLWAAGVAVSLTAFGLLYQIFRVDWSMTNYGGRYFVSVWPAVVLLFLFALSTMRGLSVSPVRQKRAVLIGAAVLFLFDLYIGGLIHQFYTDNPRQEAVQRSSEVE